MDIRVRRLTQMGVKPKTAQALVDAGMGTPRKIKAAKYADLRKAKADRDTKVKAWRKK